MQWLGHYTHLCQVTHLCQAVWACCSDMHGQRLCWHHCSAQDCRLELCEMHAARHATSLGCSGASLCVQLSVLMAQALGPGKQASAGCRSSIEGQQCGRHDLTPSSSPLRLPLLDRAPELLLAPATGQQGQVSSRTGWLLALPHAWRVNGCASEWQALLCAIHPPEPRSDQASGRPCCMLPLKSAWQASSRTKLSAVRSS